MQRYYDMQPMFNRQTDGDMRKQRSLEFAMEYYGIAQNLPAHDALNDAYFTALVAQKLDIAKGIQESDAIQGEFLEAVMLGDADGGEQGFISPLDVLKAEAVAAPKCPLCGQPLANVERTLHSKGQKYLALFSCPEHGELFVQVRLQKNLNGTWRAKKLVYPAEEEKKKNYMAKLALEERAGGERRRPRRHRKRRSDGAAEKESRPENKSAE